MQPKTAHSNLEDQNTSSYSLCEEKMSMLCWCLTGRRCKGIPQSMHGRGQNRTWNLTLSKQGRYRIPVAENPKLCLYLYELICWKFQLVQEHADKSEFIGPSTVEIANSCALCIVCSYLWLVLVQRQGLEIRLRLFLAHTDTHTQSSTSEGGQFRGEFNLPCFH